MGWAMGWDGRWAGLEKPGRTPRLRIFGPTPTPRIFGEKQVDPPVRDFWREIGNPTDLGFLGQPGMTEFLTYQVQQHLPTITHMAVQPFVGQAKLTDSNGWRSAVDIGPAHGGPVLMG